MVTSAEPEAPTGWVSAVGATTQRSNPGPGGASYAEAMADDTGDWPEEPEPRWGRRAVVLIVGVLLIAVTIIGGMAIVLDQAWDTVQDQLWHD